MNDVDASVFVRLFNEAHAKCFGHSMNDPLSETESKLFSNKIFDQTGLVIGPKSIRNYSLYILNPNGKDENPSIATLDTLARYVLNAPYSDEVQRKNKESHYPYWFQFKDQFFRSQKKPPTTKASSRWIALSSIGAILILVTLWFLANGGKQKAITDNFSSVTEDSLTSRGWFVQSKDEASWERRSELPGALSLFTLKGDNWPDSLNKPGIKNLLLRKISSECFTTEVHLFEFVPKENWQQAGIVLLEDTSFTRKGLRLSLLYNDFYGGFPKSKEIVIQGVVSNGKNFDKPEEIAHQLLYKIDSTNENLVKENLRHSALRIEKNGKKFRLLYANGVLANSAFKEIISRDIDIKPRFVGLFALRGFVDSASAIPAKFDFFKYSPQKCEK
jgi:Beta xylosidase C-terminal Concanavalin A-like domain